MSNENDAINKGNEIVWSDQKGKNRFIVGNCEIVVNDKFVFYVELRKKFTAIAEEVSKEYTALYKSYGNIDHFIEKGLQDGGDMVLKCIQEFVIKELINKYLIHNIDIARFCNEFYLKEESGAYSWPEAFSKVKDKYAEIVLKGQELDAYRTARRENRGRFIGGGFGLGGAIGGALQAGALNMAMGAAHGVFNMVGKAVSSIGEKREKTALYNNESVLKMLENAMYESVAAIHWAYWNLLVKCGAIDLSGEFIPYFSIAAINEAQAIRNNMHLMDKIDFALAFKDVILVMPYNAELYCEALVKLRDENGDLSRLARFFGVDLDYIKRGLIEDRFKDKMELMCESEESALDMQKELDHLLHIYGMSDCNGLKGKIKTILEKHDIKARTASNGAVFSMRDARSRADNIALIITTAPSWRNLISTSNDAASIQRGVTEFKSIYPDDFTNMCSVVVDTFIKKLDPSNVTELKDAKAAFPEIVDSWGIDINAEAGTNVIDALIDKAEIDTIIAMIRSFGEISSDLTEQDSYKTFESYFLSLKAERPAFCKQNMKAVNKCFMKLIDRNSISSLYGAISAIPKFLPLIGYADQVNGVVKDLKKRSGDLKSQKIMKLGKAFEFVPDVLNSATFSELERSVSDLAENHPDNWSNCKGELETILEGKLERNSEQGFTEAYKILPELFERLRLSQSNIKVIQERVGEVLKSNDEQQRTVTIPGRVSIEAKTFVLSTREYAQAGRDAVQRYEQMFKSRIEDNTSNIDILRALHDDKTTPPEIIDVYKHRIVDDVLLRPDGATTFIGLILGYIKPLIAIAIAVVFVLWATDQITYVLSSPGTVQKLTDAIWGYGNAHTMLWRVNKLKLAGLVIPDFVVLAAIMFFTTNWSRYRHTKIFHKTYCNLFGKEDLERVKTLQ